MNHRGDNMTSVKRYNRSVILKLLHENGQLSRKRIAEEMKLTPAAITMIVGEMIQEGLLVEGSTLQNNGAVGRKEVMVNINSHAFVALGVSINLHEAQLSATKLDGELIFSETVAFEPADGIQSTVEELCSRLKTLVRAKIAANQNIIGLGIAVRGIVDTAKRLSVNSFGAFPENNVPILSMFEQHTSIPATLDNNVRSMFRAHMFLSADEPSSLFFIRCEKGIGGAMSADHHVLSGSSGKCSEFGHIPVIEQGGKPCHCGKTGCLETVASPMAIVEDVKNIYSKDTTPRLFELTGGKTEEITVPLIMDAAQQGDSQVDAIVQSAANRFASAIKSVIYTVDPERVILYGSIFELEYYYKCLQSKMRVGLDMIDKDYAVKSSFNLMLEDKAACIIAVETFFANGGMQKK